MKTEFQKCLDGERFNCIDNELKDYIVRARRLTAQYNKTDVEDNTAREEILRNLFGSIGANVKIDVPFYCDYGVNISMGNNVIININCTFVDCNKIEIGNNVLIASNVQIYTATHPVDVNERIIADWEESSGHAFFNTFTAPVKIGNNVWIGGGVIILPGVTIGDNSVIGAGSVVARSIPADCVAVGNPCRVIRQINKH